MRLPAQRRRPQARCAARVHDHHRGRGDRPGTRTVLRAAGHPGDHRGGGTSARLPGGPRGVRRHHPAPASRGGGHPRGGQGRQGRGPWRSQAPVLRASERGAAYGRGRGDPGRHGARTEHSLGRSREGRRRDAGASAGAGSLPAHDEPRHLRRRGRDGRLVPGPHGDRRRRACRPQRPARLRR
ncbi:hypothetical protein D3C86_1361640 [compost metagenome]